ncbi:hypothetical protein CsSME_00009633 [Camellia sinensis var. sinensis]
MLVTYFVCMCINFANLILVISSNLYQERGLVNFPFRISLCHWFSRVSILVADMQVVFQCSSANSRFHLCSSRCCQGGRSTIIPQGVACLMFPCPVLLKACFPFLTILLVGCLCVMGEYLNQLQLGHWLLPFQIFLLQTRGRCWAKICIHFAEQLVPVMETEGNWLSSGDGSEVFCICWSHQKQALKAEGCGGCLK